MLHNRSFNAILIGVMVVMAALTFRQVLSTTAVVAGSSDTAVIQQAPDNGSAPSYSQWPYFCLPCK